MMKDKTLEIILADIDVDINKFNDVELRLLKTIIENTVLSWDRTLYSLDCVYSRTRGSLEFNSNSQHEPKPFRRSVPQPMRLVHYDN